MIGIFEHHAIEEMPERSRALLEINERRDRSADDHDDMIALGPHKRRKVDNHACERRQVGAKALEQVLKRRNNENQQNRRNDKGDDQDGGRVGQRLLDLLLDRFGFFFVRRNLVEQRLECTGLFAGLDQVDEQVVKIQWVFGKRFGQRATAFDIGLDRQNQFLHRRIFMAVADDLECLHQRDTSRQHGRKLATENRDISRW